MFCVCSSLLTVPGTEIREVITGVVWGFCLVWLLWFLLFVLGLCLVWLVGFCFCLVGFFFGGGFVFVIFWFSLFGKDSNGKEMVSFTSCRMQGFVLLSAS